jgi:Rrf2 family protein
MRLVQSHTDYAARAIMFIARSGQGTVVSTADLERELGLPRPFLRKILQELQKQGVLTSSKGNKGGFCLNLPPDKIYLIDLMNIFQGGVQLTECIFHQRVCPNVSSCPIRKNVKDIERSIVSILSGITIADLLEK